MKLNKQNWFDDLNGRNIRGYDEIERRLDFLSMEWDNLTYLQRRYEGRVIKTLTRFVPGDTARNRFIVRYETLVRGKK